MYAGLSNSAALDPMTRDWDFPSSLLLKVGTAGTQEEARAHMLFTMLTHTSTSGYKESKCLFNVYLDLWIFFLFFIFSSPVGTSTCFRNTLADKIGGISLFSKISLKVQ